MEEQLPAPVKYTSSLLLENYVVAVRAKRRPVDSLESLYDFMRNGVIRWGSRFYRDKNR